LVFGTAMGLRAWQSEKEIHVYTCRVKEEGRELKISIKKRKRRGGKAIRGISRRDCTDSGAAETYFNTSKGGLTLGRTGGEKTLIVDGNWVGARKKE